MSEHPKTERLLDLYTLGKERLVADLARRNDTKADTQSGARTTERPASVAVTRRTYLVAAGVASVATVPVVSAGEGDGYGEGEYGLQSYGGVSS